MIKVFLLPLDLENRRFTPVRVADFRCASSPAKDGNAKGLP